MVGREIRWAHKAHFTADDRPPVREDEEDEVTEPVKLLPVFEREAHGEGLILMDQRVERHGEVTIVELVSCSGAAEIVHRDLQGDEPPLE